MNQSEYNRLGYAPIILFVYSRLDHTIQAIEALRNNPESKYSDLFIYADAAKNNKVQEAVNAVRRYIKKLEGFRSVTVIERPYNYGIEKSEIDALNSILPRYGKAIIIEDDIIVSEKFLSFINDALHKYEDEKQVFGITGFSYLHDDKADIGTMFLKFASVWGWATWWDRWSLFETNPKDWLDFNKKTIIDFNYDSAYDWYDMMKKQYEEVHGLTWDIRWYYTMYKHNGLYLWPSAPLCINSGFDGSGVHCPDDHGKEVSLASNVKTVVFPSHIEETKKNRRKVCKQLKAMHPENTWIYKFAIFRNHIKKNILKIIHLWRE